MGGWEDASGPRRLPGAVAPVGVVVAFVALAGLVGSLVGRGSGGGLAIEDVPSPDASALTIDPGDPSQAEEVPVGVPPVTVGAWRARPRAPVGVPAAHVGAWTGAELVVFGGAGEVAAFDPHGGDWRVVPPPPRAVRGLPAPIWAGDELLVWSRDGDVGLRLGAGLGYRPEDDAWRSLAPPPGAPVSAAVAVWTGRDVVVVGPRGALAYEPATDAWRRLASPGRARVARAAGMWTGREVVVWGGRDHDDGGRGDEPAFAEAYDPRRDAWRRLPRPLLGDPATAAAVWTGEELLLWGSPVAGAGDAAPPAGAALNPEAGRWRLLPPPPGMRERGAADRLYGVSAVWTGDHAVFHGGYPRSVGLVFDPSRRRWANLPRRAASVNHVAAWTGDAMLVWGGYGRRGPTVGLVDWRPVGAARPPL